LLEEVTVRAVELHSVEPGRDSSARTLPVLVDQAWDLVELDGPRSGPERARNVRGRGERRLVPLGVALRVLPAGVVDLDRDLRTFVVHGFGEIRQSADKAVVVDADGVPDGSSDLPVHRRVLENDQPDTTPRPGPVVLDEPLAGLTPGRGELRARAKSALRGLTCGYGGQRPRSSLLSRRCAPHLHGEHLTQAQVGATWRSVSGRDGPESAPDRSLSTPASEQVNRVSDDFARALPLAPDKWALMAVDRYAADDRSLLGPGTSANMMPACTTPAAGVQLIGFHCLVCGYLLRVAEGRPVATPTCAGSKARTGKQHEPARMRPIFLS
jgi:hypothetical protein